jgi:hypothetical protein
VRIIHIVRFANRYTQYDTNAGDHNDFNVKNDANGGPLTSINCGRVCDSGSPYLLSTATGSRSCVIKEPCSAHNAP